MSLLAFFLLFFGCGDEGTKTAVEASPAAPVVVDRGILQRPAGAAPEDRRTVTHAAPVMQFDLGGRLRALSGDGRFLLEAGGNNRFRARVWDVDRGAFVREIDLSGVTMRSVFFAGDRPGGVDSHGRIVRERKDKKRLERLPRAPCDVTLVTSSDNDFLVTGGACAALYLDGAWLRCELPDGSEVMGLSLTEEFAAAVGIDATGKTFARVWPARGELARPEETTGEPAGGAEGTAQGAAETDTSGSEGSGSDAALQRAAATGKKTAGPESVPADAALETREPMGGTGGPMGRTGGPMGRTGDSEGETGDSEGETGVPEATATPIPPPPFLDLPLVQPAPSKEMGFQPEIAIGPKGLVYTVVAGAGIQVFEVDTGRVAGTANGAANERANGAANETAKKLPVALEAGLVDIRLLPRAGRFLALTGEGELIEGDLSTGQPAWKGNLRATTPASPASATNSDGSAQAGPDGPARSVPGGSAHSARDGSARAISGDRDRAVPHSATNPDGPGRAVPGSLAPLIPDGPAARTIPDSPARIEGISESGERVLVALEKPILIDLPNWRLLPVLPSRRPVDLQTIVWNPQGEQLIVAWTRVDKDGLHRMVSFWPLAKSGGPKTLSLELRPVPAGDSLAGNSPDSDSPAGNSPAGNSPAGNSLLPDMVMALSRDGQLLAVSGEKNVYLIKTQVPERYSRVAASNATSIVFHPDGESLYTVDNEGQVYRWEAAGDEVGQQVTQYGPRVNDAAGNAEQGILVMALAREGKSRPSLEVLAPERRQVLRRVRTGSSLDDVEVSPKGNLVAGTRYPMNGIRLWSLPQGFSRRGLRNAQARTLAFSPDGRYLVFGDTDLRKWKVGSKNTSGGRGYFLAHLPAELRAVAMSDSNRCVFTMDSRGEVGVYDSRGRRRFGFTNLDDENWLIYGNNGAYAGTPGGLWSLRLVAGDEVLSAETATNLGDGAVWAQLKETCRFK